MRQITFAIALVLTTAACAKPVYFEPAGRSFAIDDAECRLEGTRVQASSAPELGQIFGQRAYDACLRARGYQRAK